MFAAKNEPKIVKIGPKWPKIAIYIWSFFEKNIPSDLAKKCLKYGSRTTLHFDIGLGWFFNEKFFTTAKLRFGVLLSLPLEETDLRAR